MGLAADFLYACEVHSPDGIRAAISAGLSPTAAVNGKTPFDSLLEAYLRSPRFTECVRALIEAGAGPGDAFLEALFSDDDVALRLLPDASPPAGAGRRLTVPCAFTSCNQVTALHLCAEFNLHRCASVLLEAGADVDAAAGVDVAGFGGQTPVFHSVNSIFNSGRPMLELLVEAGADLTVRLKGLVWGPGAEWETLVLDVTPTSYAQCGLYRQFHRDEKDVYANLAYLFDRRYGVELRPPNVPNRYLSHS